MLTTTQALNFGIHRRTLYKLRDEGKLVKVARGLYRLANMSELSNPDLVTVAMKVPKGVVCLISALSFHDITTHIPHKVNVAIKRGSRTPRLKFPPIDVVRFSGESFEKGIETKLVPQGFDAISCLQYQKKSTDRCISVISTKESDFSRSALS